MTFLLSIIAAAAASALTVLVDMPVDHNSLSAGYNYHLLESYARQSGKAIEIRRADGPVYENLKQLRKGEADILVVRVSDYDNYKYSIVNIIEADGTALWITNKWHSENAGLELWLKGLPKSGRYRYYRSLFLGPRQPFTVTVPKPHVSPYDSLFRVSAKKIGWDWRLLAAVAYQESRFHIEAKSHKGAMGLMQMMESTAARFGLKNTFNPEKSIEAGAKYLSYLEKGIPDSVTDIIERRKLAISAYNCGENRLLRKIQESEVEIRSWEDIRSSINRAETSRYVENIFAVFRQYELICPDEVYETRKKKHK